MTDIVHRDLQFIVENIGIFIKSHYFLVKYEVYGGKRHWPHGGRRAEFFAICEGNEAHNLDSEDDFEQTLAMLDMDVEEVMIEVQNSHEEVS